jgi:putative nucleotidyltransferase with HDIG domain
VAAIVRSHHERWDGDGYPDGRADESIPLLARVIAAGDAFVAIASDRPHRRGVGVEAALTHVERERGRQLDPAVVDALVGVLAGEKPARSGVPRRTPQAASGRTQGNAKRPPGSPGGLRGAIDRFEVVPAFGPAVERLLAALADGTGTPGGDAVAAVESDTGLTVAVLRAAQSADGRAIANVADAVMALTPAELRDLVSGLPRAAFPWRTPLEAFMHQLRVHTQAVSRAVERIAREVDLPNSDDLLVAALLHDVGKLVWAHARAEVASSPDERTTAPELRLQKERQATGLDHASVGGLLVRRWGLPAGLASAVSAHHTATAEGELATLVRLADMVAHHANGDAVNRTLMLRLAQTCGLPVSALRDALFDLPHAGGSQRRRAEPSPLSARETAVLRRLAEGKVYKEIALDLDLSTSTVRTHLHNAYTKMSVGDRAQAVLRATEMAWI